MGSFIPFDDIGNMQHLQKDSPICRAPGSAAHMLPGSGLQSKENTVTPENKAVFLNGRDVYAMA